MQFRAVPILSREKLAPNGLNGNFRLARHDLANSDMTKRRLKSSLRLTLLRPQRNIVRHDRSGRSDQPRRRPFVLGQQAGLIVILVLLGALFTSKSPGFLSSFNLFVLGRSLAIDIVIGFSQMVVLATGGMNLSVGSIGVCVVMMGGYLMQVAGLSVPLACALALVLGGALGWLNGFTIVRSGVNSFIVTLASANLFSGAMLILTKATPLNSLPRSVAAFGQDADRGRLGVADARRRGRDRRRADHLLPLFGYRPASLSAGANRARGRDVARAGRDADHRGARALAACSPR